MKEKVKHIFLLIMTIFLLFSLFIGERIIIEKIASKTGYEFILWIITLFANIVFFIELKKVISK